MSSYLKLCFAVIILHVAHLQAKKFRIFDGQDLRHNVHKYLVKLVLGQSETGPYCSGSILNSWWVITAAHCCIEPDLVKIYVQHYIRGHMKIIAEVDSRKIVWHPKYDYFKKSLAFDVALLKTRKAIEFDKYVQPIRLATKTPKAGQSAIIVGYGDNEYCDIEAREGPVILTECSSVYEELLCSEASVSAGDGDSGGALVSRGHLVGVTTASCNHTHELKPCLTLYVNIAKNHRWIKKIIKT